MKDAHPQAIELKDYQPPNYYIDETQLNFQLGEKATLVNAHLRMRKNPAATSDTALRLHGCDFELKRLLLDGRPLAKDDYYVEGEYLTIEKVPDDFDLEVVTLLKPQDNTSLEGLYKSQKMFCTQCEAEGFRKITYYLDRPDVMSTFTTTILADKKRYPVLLSNGNKVDSGELDNGMHWVKWVDPFRKPSYLFALVAGDLRCVKDTFTTMSGRCIDLQIFVEEKDLRKCDHAMQSLKHAMRWDEETYGREYDLDIFMIVAVDDFNMGAMENKGLNIFNTSCVLADPQITTDKAFQRVEGVVGHEYFHNWSGNRVTCRDWFQLSLKEGFTVFRDAQFSSAMGSEVVKRVEDVSLLRTAQFAEDAGPMAHPVQPDSYIEISNFYTLTIYEKGAEIVRMLHTLLGAEVFRRGSDHYFETYDGQAVTIDEFVGSMEHVSGRDLGQFKRWYKQPGTPTLNVRSHYSAADKSYELTISQQNPKALDSKDSGPLLVPVSISLLGDAGALPLVLRDATPDTETDDNTECILEVTEMSQTFVFDNVEEAPVPSLLRGFSAPVKLTFDYSQDDLMFLMSRGNDGFNRWDASQQLALRVAQGLITDFRQNRPLYLNPKLIAAYRIVLQDESLDKAMVALMLELPSEAYIAESMDVVDVEAIHVAREFMRKKLAQELKRELLKVYSENQLYGHYSADANSIAKRSLKNTALAYLMLLDDQEIAQQCLDQYRKATNMTDTAASLSALVNSEASFVNTTKIKALQLFYRRFKDEALAINLWLTIQATCKLPGTLLTVQELLNHDAFDIKNPNKVRALIAAFASQNLVNFHQIDGAGYEFLTDQIITLNTVNPQIASRLLTPLTRWQRFDEQRQALMRGQLERISNLPQLSKDVFEVVSKSL